jgi:hypothetical protein
MKKVEVEENRPVLAKGNSGRSSARGGVKEKKR